jgi:hypothetical protein
MPDRLPGGTTRDQPPRRASDVVHLFEDVSKIAGREGVAFVLACGIAAAVLVLAIGAAVTEAGAGSGQLSPESSTLLSTVLGAAVGAIATYLGTRGNVSEPVEPEEWPEPPDQEITREFPPHD